MKKHKKVIFACFALSLLLFGCNNESANTYSDAIENGLDSLIVEDYTKAEAYFELAVEANQEGKATIYLQQTQFLKEAHNLLENENLVGALEKVGEARSIENGSIALTKKANELFSKIEDIEINLTKFTNEFEEANTLVESGKLEEALVTLDGVMDNNRINDIHYLEIKEKGEELSSIINQKLKNAELERIKAEEERKIAEAERITEENESKRVSQEQEKLQGNTNTLEAYNELNLLLKVLLATTTVDERAMSPELRGYNVNYNFDGDNLLVNVHSGAGSGHPWYVIHYDWEAITPVEGVVYMGIMGYGDVSVDSTPISKIDLYTRYLESKESYDLALKNVVEQPGMTLFKFEELRSLIN